MSVNEEPGVAPPVQPPDVPNGNLSPGGAKANELTVVTPLTPAEDIEPDPLEKAAQAAQADEPIEAAASTEKTPTDETRRKETKALFTTAAMAEGTKAEQKATGKKKEPLTAQERVFFKYKRIYDHSTSKSEANFQEQDTEGHRGMTFDDQPIFITTDLDTGSYIASSQATGERINEVTAKYVDQAGNVFFTCNVQGHTQPVNIRAEVLMNAFTLANREALTKGIGEKSTAARTVAVAHINAIENPDTQVPSDAVIKEAGRSVGVVTTDGARKLVNDAEVSAEVKKELTDMLEGKNIATPEDVGNILFRINNIDSTLAAKRSQLTDIQQVITQEEKILEHLPPHSQARYPHEERIAQLKASHEQVQNEVAEMEALQKAMPQTPEALIQLVRNSYNSGKSQEFEAAIMSGNYNEMMKKLLGDLPEDHPMKKKYESMIAMAAKVGTIGIIAIVAIMIMQSMGAK